MTHQKTGSSSTWTFCNHEKGGTSSLSAIATTEPHLAMYSTKNYSNLLLNPLLTYNQMINQKYQTWLKKKRNTKLKPSLTVAKRDAISNIWLNGKVTPMPGNHMEMYVMAKKKWIPFTKNTQTNQNPLLPIVQSSTPSNLSSNSQHHRGDQDLKGG